MNCQLSLLRSGIIIDLEMARLGLVIFSLVLLFGSSVAVISEAVVASLLLLNTLLGTSNVEVAVAATIGEASTLAHKAGYISTDLPTAWHPAFYPPPPTPPPLPPIPLTDFVPCGVPCQNNLDKPGLGNDPIAEPNFDTPDVNAPVVNTPGLGNDPIPVPNLDIPDKAFIQGSRRRRRRRDLENDPESNRWTIPNKFINLPLLNPEAAKIVPVNDKTLQDLQDEIFDNLHVIAHDMASELSILLGLPPHAVEAVVTHEEDAPSFPKVLETVAKRFHAPKLLIAGLHSLIERTDYFEDNYELDDEEVKVEPPQNSPERY